MLKKMKRHIVIIIALIPILNNIVTAQKTLPVGFEAGYKIPVFADKARVEKIKQTQNIIAELFKNYADSNHLPGVAYGIVANGKLLYSGNIGYTDIDKKIPVTSSSLFRIASMSKSFTAMAILKLRDEGKLNLDDPAYKFIPELKRLKYVP